MNEHHHNHFDEYLGTEAYTKAHGVGHWDLHIAKKNDAVQLSFLLPTGGQPNLCRQQKFDKREIQAEKYTAFILVPLNSIIGLSLSGDYFSSITL